MEKISAKSIGICIPTYNRSEVLKKSLTCASEALKLISGSVYVSDNCSTDDTSVIVKLIAEDNLNVYYNKNMNNLGADRNFEKALKMCEDDYCWLMGDDECVGSNIVELSDKVNTYDADAYIITDINNLHPEGLYKIDEVFPEIIDLSCPMSYLIMSKKMVKEGNFSKYVDTNFIHVGVLVDYFLLNPHSTIGILKNNEYLFSMRPEYCEFIETIPEAYLLWRPSVIRILPLNNSEIIANRSIREALKIGGALSPRVVLSLREKGHFNIKKTRSLSTVIKSVGRLYYYRMIVIALTPRWILKLARNIHDSSIKNSEKPNDVSSNEIEKKID